MIYSFASIDAQAIKDSKNGQGKPSSSRTYKGDSVRANAQFSYPTYRTGDLSEETIAALIAQLELAETAQALGSNENGNGNGPDEEAMGGSELRILMLQQLNAIGQLRSPTGVMIDEEEPSAGTLIVPANRDRNRDRDRDRSTRVREGRLRAQQNTLQAIDDAFGIGVGQSMAVTSGNGVPRLIRRPRDWDSDRGRDRINRRGRGNGVNTEIRDGEVSAMQDTEHDTPLLAAIFADRERDDESSASQREVAQMRAAHMSLQAEEEAELNMAILLSLRERRSGQGGNNDGERRREREYRDDLHADSVQESMSRRGSGSWSGVERGARQDLGPNPSLSLVEGGGRDLSGPTPSEMAAVTAMEMAAAAEPLEGDIQSLMCMGFTREGVIRALKSSGNDIEIAADELLSRVL